MYSTLKHVQDTNYYTGELTSQEETAKQRNKSLQWFNGVTNPESQKQCRQW